MQPEIENGPPPLSKAEIRRNEKRDAHANPNQTTKSWEKMPDYGGLHPLSEPPTPESGQLVPGSRFTEEQWERATYMIAGGCPFIQVAKTVGVSRTTLWRAYHLAPDFRHRVHWERRNISREAQARVRSLEHMVSVQLEKAVARGEMKTIRWLADRLGVIVPAMPNDTGPDGFREEIPPSDTVMQNFATQPEEERPYGYHPYSPEVIENQPDWDGLYEGE
ncbi:hypothetical protein [Azospirillum sp. SYSU D00513]|uniref:hypothetical protein n=1 Tax=Azospirillum sp. SYSU D00513 TaxID=2812561 RepID=UPI001A95BC46|nr:hypothetical protein [Azospirillum sp. SYSU D00513]